jgi:hypothetical protein
MASFDSNESFVNEFHEDNSKNAVDFLFVCQTLFFNIAGQTFRAETVFSRFFWKTAGRRKALEESVQGLTRSRLKRFRVFESDSAGSNGGPRQPEKTMQQPQDIH